MLVEALACKSSTSLSSLSRSGLPCVRRYLMSVPLGRGGSGLDKLSLPVRTRS